MLYKLRDGRVLQDVAGRFVISNLSGRFVPLTRRQAQRHLSAWRASQREARRFPGMSDDQIRAWEDHAILVCGEHLAARGWAWNGESPSSESLYYQRGEHRIRLSCHDLPPNDERDHAADRGGTIQVVIRRWMPDDELIATVDAAIGDEHD